MTRTQQEQSFLECLETQAQNSGQTHVERFSNFPAWAPRQHIARFLAAEHIYRQILEVPGVVIEGGVGLGAGLFTWAHLASILEPYNYSRKIVGFDLAERDEVWKDITELAYISDYNRPLGHIPRIELVAGPAQDTIPAEAQQTKASDRLAVDESNDSEAGDSALSTLRSAATEDGQGTPHSALLRGAEHLSRVVLVDQSILGKTPRSNPAVYIGAFDDIRAFFAQSELARQRGLNASAFSFNSSQGQCERCRGAGFEKIEMQFLSDVFIRCPDCNGRRYRSHILEVKLAPNANPIAAFRDSEMVNSIPVL